LAAELRVGLDSVILVDDSPADCAEVRAHAPEVCVLELPHASGAIPAFLDGAWALDLAPAGPADRAPRQLYAAGRPRPQAARAAVFAPRSIDGALAVDSLLLSCRVLGRGVEAGVLRALGEEAARLGATRLDFDFIATARNAPARALLAALDGATVEQGAIRV